MSVALLVAVSSAAKAAEANCAPKMAATIIRFSFIFSFLVLPPMISVGIVFYFLLPAFRLASKGLRAGLVQPHPLGLVNLGGL